MLLLEKEMPLGMESAAKVMAMFLTYSDQQKLLDEASSLNVEKLSLTPELAKYGCQNP